RSPILSCPRRLTLSPVLSADPPPLPSRFFFNPTAPSEFYPLSLHDALPILALPSLELGRTVAFCLRHQAKNSSINGFSSFWRKRQRSLFDKPDQSFSSVNILLQ